jgi:2-oxoglutarate ferredoxin oxidoreductase subunit delta
MKYNHKQMNHNKKKKPRFEIHIIVDRCKGCGFCIEFCPHDVLKKSDRINAEGYYPPGIKNPENCTGCRTCELLCPDFAIFVKPEVEKKRYKSVVVNKS